MSARKGKSAPTIEELSAQLEGLGEDEVNTTSKTPPPTTKSSSKSAATKSHHHPQSSRQNKSNDQNEQDLLAELDNLATQRPPSTRPDTPRRTNTGNRQSARTSEDRGSREYASGSRRSGESGKGARFEEPLIRSARNADPPVVTKQEEQKNSGGGWWGGILATASAAVKEIQKNEEAQKWAEQVKGNVGALRGLGGRALPHLTNILQTLAPPIQRHERLRIHTTHELIGYPSLPPLIQDVFSRLMQQVEGGEVIVQGPALQSKGNGWNDGPWWRESPSTSMKRGLGAVDGVKEGAKLAKASAEAFASEWFEKDGGMEVAMRRAVESPSEDNPVRSSEVFLAIQAVTLELPAATAEGESDESDPSIMFILHLHDPIHGISFRTLSQTLPQKWIDYLETTTPSDFPELPQSPGAMEMGESEDAGLGVDPREWAADWVQEVLALCTGIVAQRYIAKRLGVPERRGGMITGERSSVDVGGGEASRAI
ncbi:MAG: hypothetical protein M1834_006985 [Cirrosporium novae-zelandiae]|nr:MAG: hypothetical protein M1834_006985 [Cirrosporium novae-zelandiae]